MLVSTQKLLLNKLVFVIQLIEGNIKRPLTETEKVVLFDQIKKYGQDFYRGKDLHTQAQNAASDFIYNLTHAQDTFSQHEYFVNHIGDNDEIDTRQRRDFDNPGHRNYKQPAVATDVRIAQIFGNKNTFDVLAAMNPQALETVSYLDFDSRNRESADSGPFTKIYWSLSLSLPFQPGAVYLNNGLIRDLLRFSIEEFDIPLVDGWDSWFNQYNKVSLCIHEFANQAPKLTSTRSCHLYFRPTVVGNRVRLTPMSEDFVFKIPFTQISTFTVSLAAPYDLIEFDADRAVVDAATAITSVGTALRCNTTTNHNLSIGDIVYFENFDTDNAADRITISTVNRARGHAVSAVPSSTQFDVSVDISALAGTKTGSTNVYYGSKRITFRMRLTHLPERKKDDM